MSAWKPGSNSNSLKLMASIQPSTAISNEFEISTVVFLNGPPDVFYIF